MAFTLFKNSKALSSISLISALSLSSEVVVIGTFAVILLKFAASPNWILFAFVVDALEPTAVE